MAEPTDASMTETLRRYAAYATRHALKFNDGRGNEIEVGPSIVSALDELDLYGRALARIGELNPQLHEAVDG